MRFGPMYMKIISLQCKPKIDDMLGWLHMADLETRDHEI